jgi:hypothetical protein
MTDRKSEIDAKIEELETVKRMQMEQADHSRQPDWCQAWGKGGN